MSLVVARDNAEARQLQRLEKEGKLRRVTPGVYTDEPEKTRPLEVVVRSELLALCALVASGSVISHRSAFEQKPTPGGNFYLTGRYRRNIKLPGVTLRIDEGTSPLSSDIRIPTFFGDAHYSSQARALLENLTQSRGDPAERRTLGGSTRGMRRTIRALRAERSTTFCAKCSRTREAATAERARGSTDAGGPACPSSWRSGRS